MPQMASAIGISSPRKFGSSSSSPRVRSLAIATRIVAKMPVTSRIIGEGPLTKPQTMSTPRMRVRMTRTIVGRCETSVMYNSLRSSAALRSRRFARLASNSANLGSYPAIAPLSLSSSASSALPAITRRASRRARDFSSERISPRATSQIEVAAKMAIEALMAVLSASCMARPMVMQINQRAASAGFRRFSICAARGR